MTSLSQASGTCERNVIYIYETQDNSCWCGAVENQKKKKGRKKIAVDFVNIGKHFFSLASYTRLSLSLSLSLFVFLIFGLHLLLFLLSLTPTCSSEKLENISSFLAKERRF
jgi:hypothetical protein